MMSGEGSSLYTPEDDPFRNITVRRRTKTVSHNIPSEGDEEDPTVASLYRKLMRTVEDLEELHAAGLAAKCTPAKAKKFLTMHQVATEKTFSRFNELYDELTDVIGDADISNEDLAMRRDVKSLYFSLCLMAEELRQVPPPTHSDISTLPSRSRAKLPTIELVSFDGQRTNWKRFKDTFESLVIKDTELTLIDKFHYLISSLKGSASATIAQLSVTAENFPIAWQALIEAYDNPRILATAYLDQLLNIKALGFKPSTDQLTQVTNQISESVAAFKQINIPDKTEFILFYLARRCLDKCTREAFEFQQDSSQLPTFAGLIKFLRHRCLASELAVGIKAPSTVMDSRPSVSKPFSVQRKPHYYCPIPKDSPSLMVTPSCADQRGPSTFQQSNKKPSLRPASRSHSPCALSRCPVCSERHPVLKCFRFQNMTVRQRHASLADWNGCLNCLYPTHFTNGCKARGRCKYCSSRRHHTLLHEDKIPSTASKQLGSTSTSGQHPEMISSNISNTCCTTQPRVAHVMLGTAMCSIRDTQGSLHNIRLVLDSGSQFSFLTRDIADRLSLPINTCDIRILGIGQTPFLGFQGKALCQLVSHTEPVEVSTHALVVDTITSSLPSTPVSLEDSYTDYNLADPHFGDPRPVDFLLGADLFTEVLTGEIISLEPSLPKLTGTIFGYVIMGRVNDLSAAHQFHSLCATSKVSPDQVTLLEDLQRLWDLEHIEPSSLELGDPEDIAYENYFRQTHNRLSTGRYVVRLPFKGVRPHFPSNKWMAVKRLTNNESNLHRDPELKSLYQDFMKEYCELGHMQKTEKVGEYLIPHHGVVKQENDHRKIRVVFDASSRTSIGSLNDFLQTGPKLQNNIVHILLNFRKPNIVFTVDLVKMFRQILVHSDDRCYQHILWRFNLEDPVEEYELSTITYGLGPAPYLAIRSIQQLCEDEGKYFPLAAKVVTEDMYVDDLATGADTLAEALDLQQQIIQPFKRGEFPLSKWASNRPRLLDIVETDQREASSQPRSIEDPGDKCRVKILGLQWDPTEDAFMYDVQPPPLVFTKRSILSAVTRIYDPLGLLSPLIILAKALIQSSWKPGLEWDEQLPEYLQVKWSNFVANLVYISKLRIPRWVCRKKRRWKVECLHDLQLCSKWRQPQRNLAVNDLVMVQGVTSDRLKWPLERISEVFPGDDGVVRVVNVRTTKGIFKRPAAKFIPLIEAVSSFDQSPSHNVNVI